jgi:hypothetical protein
MNSSRQDGLFGHRYRLRSGVRLPQQALLGLLWLMNFWLLPLPATAEDPPASAAASTSSADKKTADKSEVEKSETVKSESAKSDATTTGMSEWAARAKATELPRQHLDPQSTQQSVLKTEVKVAEQVWLETPSDKGKFLAVAIKEASATPQGALVAIPDYGQHAHWPVLVKPLGELLPDKGWYVFSVSMPQRFSVLPPDRELAAKTLEQIIVSGEQTVSGDAQAASSDKAGDDAAKENTAAPGETVVGNAAPAGAANETAVAIDLGADKINQNTDSNADSNAGQGGAKNELTESAAEIAGARVSAALDFVKSKGYGNLVIIGIRSGASHIFDYLAANKGSLPRRGFAVIMIDARFDTPDLEAMENAFSAGFASPVLDLVNTLDQDSVNRADQRKRVARSLQMSGYLQVKMAMTSQSLQDPQSVLMHRIAGWLSVHAPGTKATKFKR